MSPRGTKDASGTTEGPTGELVRRWIEDAWAKARQRGYPYQPPSAATVQHIVRVVNGLKRAEFARWEHHEKRLRAEKKAVDVLKNVLPALIKEREKDIDDHRIDDDQEYLARLQLYEAVRAFGSDQKRGRRRGRPRNELRHASKALCGPIHQALIEATGHERSGQEHGAFVSVMVEALKAIGKENVSRSAVSEVITEFLKLPVVA